MQSTKEIGEYAFKQRDVLGSGFSSRVYRGVRKSDSTPCAVKVIEERSLTPFRRKLLENEIQSFCLSLHPNLLRCFDVYSTKNNHYIITELCENGSLSGLLAKRVPSEKESIDLLSQLVEGIFQLRRFKYFHRDIKSSNLLLNKDGVLKIADFGFACHEDKLAGQLKGRNVGTPAYMAPQAILENRYSQKSQVFAVGVIGFQLLTGRLPWSAQNQKELAKRMKERRPSFVGGRGSKQTNQLLLKCLSGDQAQRPTLEDLRNDLNQLNSKATDITTV